VTIMVSVLVLARNEEQNLLGCLEFLSWSDDIVVLDSYSTDRTVEIARAAGARVVQRRVAGRERSVAPFEPQHPVNRVDEAEA